MRLHGKDYSIIPEYRMSEHMEDYIVNSIDPFTDPTLFSLTGAAPTITSSLQDNFYKTYSHSDFMKYFDVMQQSSSVLLNSVATEFSVTCKGLMKLLPYEGFYPAQRTLQLAQLFSQSYGQYVHLTGNATHVVSSTETFLDNTPRNSFWRAFLTPMFAPGIMFNTIKSGLAVDFPIFTAQSPWTGSYDDGTGKDGGANLAMLPAHVIVQETFDERVPFEALVEPEAYIAGKKIYDMEPHPSCSFSGTWSPSDNAHAVWRGDGDERYKRAAHNFLAETPEFFLANGTFTSFFSAPQSQWRVPDPKKTYRMRIKVRKSYEEKPAVEKWRFDNSPIPYYKNLKVTGSSFPQVVSGSETICMYSRPSAFGPPIGGGPQLSGAMGATTGLNDVNRGFIGDSRHGYYPHVTPCYYDGEAWADLEYNPGLYADKGLGIDLEEFLSRVTASYLRFAGTGDTAFATNGMAGPYPAYTSKGAGTNGAGGPMYGPAQCNTNSQQVTSSINIFGTTKGLKELLRYSGYTADDQGQWVIQAKFETPILNFIECSSSTGATPPGVTTMAESTGTTGLQSNQSYMSGGAATRPIGMWHQYGRVPSGSEGIFLEIADTPFDVDDIFPRQGAGGVVAWPGAVSPKGGATGSLAELVGFSKRPQPLGRVAPTKVIREAVVAVPFFEQNGARQFYRPGSNFAQVKAAIEAPEGAEIQGVRPSVKTQIDAMKRYVFPPSMDFITYPDQVPAISMYIFEFEHSLNQQDLVDIWQNLPPRIGRAFDPDTPLITEDIVQSKTITHFLQEGELLTAIDPKLQWMVFKVKQRAARNYFNKTVTNNANISPSIAFNASFVAATLAPTQYVAQGAGQGAVERGEDYLQSYNWPYDFFSLVELVKIDDDVSFYPDSRRSNVLTELGELQAAATTQSGNGNGGNGGTGGSGGTATGTTRGQPSRTGGGGGTGGTATGATRGQPSRTGGTGGGYGSP